MAKVESLGDTLLLSVAYFQSHARPGVPWTRAAFEQMQHLQRLGLVRDRDGHHGYILTERGEQYVQELAEGNDTLSLPERMVQDEQAEYRATGRILIPGR